MQFLHCDPATLITEFSASVKNCYQDLVNLEKTLSKTCGSMLKWWTLLQVDQKSI